MQSIEYTIELTVAYVNTKTNAALKLNAVDMESVLEVVYANFENTINDSDIAMIKLNPLADEPKKVLVISMYDRNLIPSSDEVAVNQAIKMCKLQNGADVETVLNKKSIAFKIKSGVVVSKVWTDVMVGNELLDDASDNGDLDAEPELKAEPELEAEPIVETPEVLKTPAKAKGSKEPKTPKAPKKSKATTKPDTEELPTPINLIEAIDAVIASPAPKKGGRPKKTEEEKLADKERKLLEKKEQKEAEKKRKLEAKLSAREAIRDEQKEAKKEERNAKRRELNALLKTMTPEKQEEYKANLKLQTEEARAQKKAETAAKRAQSEAIRAEKAKTAAANPPKKTKSILLIEELETVITELNATDFKAISKKDELLDRDMAVADVFCSLVGITDKSWKNVRSIMGKNFVSTYLTKNYTYSEEMDNQMKDMQSRVRFYKKSNKTIFEEAVDLNGVSRWMFTVFDILNQDKKQQLQKERNAEKNAMIAQIKQEKLDAIAAEKQRKIDEKNAKKEESARKKLEREAKKQENETKKAEREAKKAAKLAATSTDTVENDAL